MPAVPGQTPAAADAKAPETPAAYLTIDPAFKAVFDRIERADKPPLLTLVADPRNFLLADLGRRLQLKLRRAAAGDALEKQWKVLEKQDLKAIGLTLATFTEGKASLTLALDTPTDAAAKALEQLVEAGLKVFPAAIKAGLNLDVTAPDAGSPHGPGHPGPGQPMNPAGFPGPPMGMRPMNPDGTAAPPPPPKGGDLLLSRRDTTVLVTLNLSYGEAPYRRILNETEAVMVELRGNAEMASDRSRVHELANVLQAYLAAKGSFPRGTLPRPSGADFPPQLRQSWLADLLPFLRGDYKDLPREADKTWQEGDNLTAAQVLVPQFLSRTPPYYVNYPGVAPALAATHFVGVAGVGLDAATYNPADPAAAKKLGVFGYDRVTKPADVKDGLDQTIVALQIPPEQRAPWLGGGGGTVRGISEELDALEPFVCLKYEGKPGTFAIMGDGKVRFLPANLPPETFRRPLHHRRWRPRRRPRPPLPRRAAPRRRGRAKDARQPQAPLRQARPQGGQARREARGCGPRQVTGASGQTSPGEKLTMSTISIEVDAETARTFAGASNEERGKLHLLLALWLRELVNRPLRPLADVMNEIGQRAESRGLTLEIVESVLHDE